MKFLFVLLVLVWTTPGKVAAQDACVDVGGTALQMRECYAAELEQLTSAVDSAVVQLGEGALPAELDSARRAHQLWLDYVEAECTWRAAESVGGTIHPLVIVSCRIELTKLRLERLRRWLDVRRAREDAEEEAGATGPELLRRPSNNKQLQAPFAALTSTYMARYREPRLQL